MPYQISTPYPVVPIRQICVAHNVFTPEELDKIDYLEELQDFQAGTVGSNKKGTKIKDSDARRVDKTARNSRVSFIMPDRNSQYIFDRFTPVLQQVNLDHFRRDIHGLEFFQYTIYEKGEFYDWHFDHEMLSQKYVRKISATIMLSNPEVYEGGELEIITIGSPEQDKIYSTKPNRGDVVFFASWMPHRVKPVTKGKRKSLVAWVMGEDRG
jgi:PKHD-type hydroxylase